ncbi:hypothetical protein BVU76_15780 [Mycolicibacterium porcinum]|nr:hypothetical protein BVU76_15780 [Mycolicibacterium porcinum]
MTTVADGSIRPQLPAATIASTLTWMVERTSSGVPCIWRSHPSDFGASGGGGRRLMHPNR